MFIDVFKLFMRKIGARVKDLLQYELFWGDDCQWWMGEGRGVSFFIYKAKWE